MNLTRFITGLLTDGNVVVNHSLDPFSKEDMAESAALLQQMYRRDAEHTPYEAPEFSATAAIWAAQFSCRAAQFLLLRDQRADQVTAMLKPFETPFLPESVFSADLTLRHLPALMQLGRTLAPDDVLVRILRETVLQWPLSSPGIPLDAEADLRIILDHPALRTIYIDRVIAAKDARKTAHPLVSEYVRAALGAHGQEYWPDFTLLTQNMTAQHK